MNEESTKPEGDEMKDEERSAVGSAERGTDAPRGAPNGGDESETGERGKTGDLAAAEATVRTLLLEMTQGVGLTLSIDVESGGDTVRARLAGEDEHLLTARNGELLGAFQFLLSKVLVKEQGRGLRVEVDAGGFRQKRSEELATLARKTAAAVRKSGKRALLPLMTPAERREIHVALADEPDVVTESEGDGFKKRVAVFLRSSAPGD